MLNKIVKRQGKNVSKYYKLCFGSTRSVGLYERIPKSTSFILDGKVLNIYAKEDNGLVEIVSGLSVRCISDIDINNIDDSLYCFSMEEVSIEEVKDMVITLIKNKLTDKYREKIINKFNNQCSLLNEMQTSYYKNKLDEYDGELIIDNFIKRHR